MAHPLIERVAAGKILTGAEADALMEELLSGRMETPEIVRLLTALNTRPYQAEELVGFARAMRRNAARVVAEGAARPANMVDTCGTGGDASYTFNISTAAAFVAAAAGAHVAKHGKRRRGEFPAEIFSRLAFIQRHSRTLQLTEAPGHRAWGHHPLRLT